MRAVVLLNFVFLIPVFGLESRTGGEYEVPSINSRFHDEISIPLGKKIYEAEKAIFEKQEGFDISRIVGGDVSSHARHPYLGGLQIHFPDTTNVGVCSTSLLSRNRCVTSAHCWQTDRQAWQFTVVLGSQYLFFGLGTRINTTEVVMHPRWNFTDLSNDVAVIYLPTDVVFTELIQPVSLPTASLLRQSFARWTARAAGYGRISDNVPSGQGTQVHNVALEVIEEETCRGTFGDIIIESTICTSGVGGVGVCSGDSGGPLVVTQNGRDVLIGVSSFVARAGCSMGFPSAYARVTSFTNWIMQHMW